MATSNPLFPNNPGYNLYKGARYVPKFTDKPDGQWDNTIAYEPLTIVLYQGNSYTSRWFVPVGADINDTTYWLPTGNFNAQLESILQKLSELETTRYTLVFPSVPNTTNPLGQCGFICYGKRAILFDLGLEQNYLYIKNSLINAGVTDISAIVISHYDADHRGNINKLYNDFNMDSCQAFIPRSTNKYPFTVEDKNLFLSLFPEAVFPNEGQTVSIDGVTLMFHNCSQATYDYYDNFTGQGTVGYNDYSNICFATVNGTTLAFLGDISGVSQRYIYANNYYTLTDFCVIPHHGITDGGEISLAMELGYSMAYASYPYIANRTSRDPFMYTMAPRMGKLFLASYNPNDVKISVSDGLSVISGVNTPYIGFSNSETKYYVNSDSTAPYQLGTERHPFKSIKECIANCNGNGKYEISVIKEADTGTQGASGILYDVHNILIDLKGNSLYGLQITKCSNITITNGTLMNPNSINYSSSVYITTCSINNTIRVNDSFGVVINGVTLLNDLQSPVVSVLRSMCDIGGVTGDFTSESLLNSQSSIVTLRPGNYSGATQLVRGDTYTIINSHRSGSDTLLKSLYTTANPVLVYSTTSNSFKIARNGELFDTV